MEYLARGNRTPYQWWVIKDKERDTLHLLCLDHEHEWTRSTEIVRIRCSVGSNKRKRIQIETKSGSFYELPPGSLYRSLGIDNAFVVNSVKYDMIETRDGCLDALWSKVPVFTNGISVTDAVHRPDFDRFITTPNDIEVPERYNIARDVSRRDVKVVYNNEVVEVSISAPVSLSDADLEKIAQGMMTAVEEGKYTPHCAYDSQFAKPGDEYLPPDEYNRLMADRFNRVDQAEPMTYSTWKAEHVINGFNYFNAHLSKYDLTPVEFKEHLADLWIEYASNWG